MKLENFSPSLGVAVQPNVRCLVGLFGSRDTDLEELNVMLEQDRDDRDILRYAMNHEDADEVRFLVGSQSFKPQGSQISLISLQESLDIDLKKQTFVHPDGEVVGITALASQPDWFISVFSSYSVNLPELRTGARVWRIPNSSECLSDNLEESSLENSNSSSSPNNQLSSLDYVTTLPLKNYISVKKIASHPSTTCSDLACIVGPPDVQNGSHIHSSLNANGNYLVLLQAPSESGAGSDYQISSSSQLCLPTCSTSSIVKPGSSNLSAICNPNSIKWSPHERTNQVAIAFDSGILGWDIRCMKPCFWLENAHWPCVRDIDYNPHRSNLLISGGDDGFIRLWDLRYLNNSKCRCAPNSNVANTGIPNASERIMQSSCDSVVYPLLAIQHHSHWVWSVRYHPTRDQLVLSSGSDCCVCLYNLASFSSDALNNESDNQPVTSQQSNTVSSQPDSNENVDEQSLFSNEEENISNKDGLIARLEQHEESVYSIDWSPVDAWYFASVSYDGNFLINRVPENVKLNILLQSKDY